MITCKSFIGTGLTKYNQHQLFLRFKRVMSIPSFCEIDEDLVIVIDFYASFLLIPQTKMKRYEIKNGLSYDFSNQKEGIRKREEKKWNNFMQKKKKSDLKKLFIGEKFKSEKKR
jgi:hypothetical protein